MTLYIAFLFHIYQPPTQEPDVFFKISKESYIPLIETIRKFQNVKVTLNINASLSEMLDNSNITHIIDGLSLMASKEQIDFTESGAYHPILPLIPEKEIIYQIKF